jgi:hypothetical protein
MWSEQEAAQPHAFVIIEFEGNRARGFVPLLIHNCTVQYPERCAVTTTGRIQFAPDI